MPSVVMDLFFAAVLALAVGCFLGVMVSRIVTEAERRRTLRRLEKAQKRARMGGL